MKLLADECCNAQLVAALRAEGHDVRYLAEERPGLTDDAVLEAASGDERVLLTEDKDFGDLVVRLGQPAMGVILLRLGAATSHSKPVRVLEVLSRHAERIEGHYVVVDNSRIRFRRLRPLDKT